MDQHDHLHHEHSPAVDPTVQPSAHSFETASQPAPSPWVVDQPQSTTPSFTLNNVEADAINDEPLAVVKVLSVRGVEYLMMSVALWVGAVSLAGILLSLVNGGHSFDVLAFPISVLVVALGLFSFFFLRLKSAELRNPRLRFDPSKRRLSQITQVVSYLASFVSLVGILYSILAKFAGSLGTPLWKILLDFVVILVVAGGILAYYWIDEHKVR